MIKETIIKIEYTSDDSSMILIGDINCNINEKVIEKYLLHNRKEGVEQLISHLQNIQLIINEIANKLNIELNNDKR